MTAGSPRSKVWQASHAFRPVSIAFPFLYLHNYPHDLHAGISFLYYTISALSYGIIEEGEGKVAARVVAWIETHPKLKIVAARVTAWIKMKQDMHVLFEFNP